MSMGIYLILILLGLVSGSFVSAVTYRLPRGLGFVKGRSFCDQCKKELRWSDNIPLISFLFYKGYSRCCNKKISIRYPLIEMASAVGIIILFVLFPPLEFVFYYFLYLVLLTIIVVDIENQIIFDELIWLTLMMSIVVNANMLFVNLFSGFIFSIFYLFLHLITKGRGMGLGDVKLAIPLGVLLGINRGLTWLLISFVLGGIIASILLLLKRANLKTKIAFGPFMIIAFWITLLMTR